VTVEREHRWSGIAPVDPAVPGGLAGLEPVLAMLPMALVVLVRLLGPGDLDNNDQAKQALYVLDILDNGNWILPLERGFQFASKPPLYAWLAALSSVALGGVSALTCQLPSVLASLGSVYLLFRIGAERWSPRVGLFAAAMFASSHTVVDLSIHVRPDMVLTLLVLLAYTAVHRLEMGQARGMPGLFWGALSVSALAKGPVGPVLIAAPLAVLSLRAPTRQALRPVLRSRWSALLLLPLSWAGLALLVGGTRYVREVIEFESVQRFMALGEHARHVKPPGYPLAHLLAQFAPWSLLAALGVGFAVAGVRARRLDARLALPLAWLVVGLVTVSLSLTQRKDYILPLLPAAALLAAVVVAEARPLARRAWAVLFGAAGLASAAAAVWIWLGGADPGDPLGALGYGWSLALGGAAGALALAGLAGARRASIPSFAVASAVSGLLILHSAYSFELSPVARGGRGAAIADFAARVNQSRRPGQELVLLAGVSNAAAFLMRAYDPPLALADLERSPSCRAGVPAPLLVVPMSSLEEIQTRWPGRFRIRAQQVYGGRGLALLEECA
jgi:4-amino-4-deoxy-L-arabinose transferase-like glycosyltransferase